MNCVHFQNGECLIASRLAGYPVAVNPDACAACSQSQVPQQPNYVTASLARGKIRQMPSEDDSNLRGLAGLLSIGCPVGRPNNFDLGEGPGTILHDLISGMGFEITPTCACLYWIRSMNQHGSAWSYEQASNIAAAMATEFKRRYPLRAKVVPVAASTLVARRLILKACREWDQQTKPA